MGGTGSADQIGEFMPSALRISLHLVFDLGAFFTRRHQHLAGLEYDGAGFESGERHPFPLHRANHTSEITLSPPISVDLGAFLCRDIGSSWG